MVRKRGWRGFLMSHQEEIGKPKQNQSGEPRIPLERGFSPPQGIFQADCTMYTNSTKQY